MTQIPTEPSRFEAVTARFPRTILEEVTERLGESGLSIKERVRLFGVTAILNNNKPFIPSFETHGIASLRSDFTAPRHAALLSGAVELATDDSVDSATAFSEWSHLYGAIANPASVFHAAVSIPDAGQSLRDEHAATIRQSLRVIGMKEGLAVDDRVGYDLLPIFTSYDMAETTDDLGSFTESVVSRALNPRQ